MWEKLRFYFSMVLFLIYGAWNFINAQYVIPSKMSWWYEARFGMFIHFGSYSYLGRGEWAFSVENWSKADYQEQVSARFNPTSFNAGDIVRLIKDAGMKYLVITAKHHEGFCMWKTSVESFRDVTGTKIYSLQGFTNFSSRDVLQELKDSCEAQGIKFCLYYSILDWCHPSQTIFHGDNWYTYSVMDSDTARKDYIRDMKLQLKELITRYHPAVLWFDGDWTYNAGLPETGRWWTKADGIDLYDYLMSIDSNLIVNERVARGFGIGDFECPEQEVPAKPLSKPWETCRTMNNSWGYNAGDSNYKEPEALIREMVITVSRDGNYLLNIGPKGDGTITQPSVDILKAFGNWMKIYGESIYGASRSPYEDEPAWGCFTRKQGKLFAHIFQWPADQKLIIPALNNKINRIYLLNNPDEQLGFTINDGNILVALPKEAPNKINSVLVIEVAGLHAVSGNKHD
jgi:alpha-L-fucosidase